MAQKTELALAGVPGRVHSFVAKEATSIVPNLEFTLTVSQDEFTLTADPELTTLEN